jgi:ubiquinone/menaquinone biosynthesis C-methylase UbiE
MLERILEPEVMDCEQEAIDYDAMDFTDVNTDFAELAISLASDTAKILDVGTGTARIPIIISNLRPDCSILAIDMAKSMLNLAQKNIDDANKTGQIKLRLADGKKMPFSSGEFDLIISNSLVHHLSDPLSFFLEIKRVLKPQGNILIRDLFRPETESQLEQILQEANLDYNPHHKKLFRDSLYAAFTMGEIANIANKAGLNNAKIYQSSNRHWTLKIINNKLNI